MTALIALPNFHLRDEKEVDNQVAAPAVTRTPNLHRANKNRSLRAMLVVYALSKSPLISNCTTTAGSARW